MGLFYLLTLYCFIRGVSVEGSGVRAGSSSFILHPSTFILPPVAWYAGSVSMCLLGMATKEVMVSAPLIVLLYDRTFCAGSFRKAWRRRYAFYLALAGTWLLLGWLVISTGGNRGGSAGFGTSVGSAAYFGTQFGAIVHYLRLCVWPHPLLFDYGMATAQGVSAIVPYAVVVGLLGLATVVALWRWPKVGFLGAWFFAILAPTSSVIPVATQVVAEHRMYLPSLAVVTGLAAGGWVLGRWLVHRGNLALPTSLVIAGLAIMFVSVTFGILTFHRNMDYQSELSLWEDTVAKAPRNARAENNLGHALHKCGRFDQAIAHYHKSLELKPDGALAHYNLGLVLVKRGEIDEAITQFGMTLQIAPDCAEAHYNLGLALAARGQLDEAMSHYQKALAIKPDYAEAHNKLGTILAGRGKTDEAMDCFRKALQIQPDLADAHNNLGTILARVGRVDEAIVHYRMALQIKPDFAEAHYNLGTVLADCGRLDEAITYFQKALEIKPDDMEAGNNLGIARSQRDEILKAAGWAA